MARQDMETWENTTKGIVAVNKFDRRGERMQEIVRGGRKFSLTPDERRLNTDMAYSPGVDAFQNGILIPVRLVDGDEDVAMIQANPNVRSIDELVELFELHWKKFDSEVSEIGNVSTLSRLLELAVEKDATVRQVASLKNRLSELDPSSVMANDGDTVQSYGEPSDGKFKAVTPG